MSQATINTILYLLSGPLALFLFFLPVFIHDIYRKIRPRKGRARVAP